MTRLFRIVALVLVPCLLLEPVSAQGFQGAFSRPAPIREQAHFNDQALTAALAASVFTYAFNRLLTAHLQASAGSQIDPGQIANQSLGLFMNLGIFGMVIAILVGLAIAGLTYNELRTDKMSRAPFTIPQSIGWALTGGAVALLVSSMAIGSIKSALDARFPKTEQAAQNTPATPVQSAPAAPPTPSTPPPAPAATTSVPPEKSNEVNDLSPEQKAAGVVAPPVEADSTEKTPPQLPPKPQNTAPAPAPTPATAPAPQQTPPATASAAPPVVAEKTPAPAPTPKAEKPLPDIPVPPQILGLQKPEPLGPTIRLNETASGYRSDVMEVTDAKFVEAYVQPGAPYMIFQFVPTKGAPISAKNNAPGVYTFDLREKNITQGSIVGQKLKTGSDKLDVLGRAYQAPKQGASLLDTVIHRWQIVRAHFFQEPEQGAPIPTSEPILGSTRRSDRFSSVQLRVGGTVLKEGSPSHVDIAVWPTNSGEQLPWFRLEFISTDKLERAYVSGALDSSGNWTLKVVEKSPTSQSKDIAERAFVGRYAEGEESGAHVNIPLIKLPKAFKGGFWVAVETPMDITSYLRVQPEIHSTGNGIPQERAGIIKSVAQFFNRFNPSSLAFAAVAFFGWRSKRRTRESTRTSPVFYSA